MAICTLHLISLNPSKTLSSLLSALRRAGVKRPLSRARVLRWMVLPQRISTGHLLARNIHWDALLIFDHDGGSNIIPAPVRDEFIAAEWTASVGTSAKLLSSYLATNAELLGKPYSPPAGQIRAATPGSRDLEYTSELGAFIAALPTRARQHPVSMLNLLAFNEGRHAQYVKYGQEFTARVGSRHGGKVKIVGKVTGSGFQGEVGGGGGGGGGVNGGKEGWEEIAFVHYPSIKHFASMASDPEYQAVNKEYRLGALKDTFIICTQEVGDDGEVVVREGKSAKL